MYFLNGIKELAIDVLIINIITYKYSLYNNLFYFVISGLIPK